MPPTAQTKVRIDLAKARAYGYRKADECARQAAEVTSKRAKAIIVAENRIATGKLWTSIKISKVATGPKHVTYRVSTNVPYAGYQEHGVDHYIYPVRAKALRFKPKGSSVYIFRKYTRGFKGIHYMRRARSQLKASDFRR